MISVTPIFGVKHYAGHEANHVSQPFAPLSVYPSKIALRHR